MNKEKTLMQLALQCTGADPDIHDVRQPNFAILMDAKAIIQFAHTIADPILVRLQLLESMVDPGAIPVSEYTALQCSAALNWLKEEAVDNEHATVALTEWEACISKLLLRSQTRPH